MLRSPLGNSSAPPRLRPIQYVPLPSWAISEQLLDPQRSAHRVCLAGAEPFPDCSNQLGEDGGEGLVCTQKPHPLSYPAFSEDCPSYRKHRRYLDHCEWLVCKQRSPPPVSLDQTKHFPSYSKHWSCLAEGELLGYIR